MRCALRYALCCLIGRRLGCGLLCRLQFWLLAGHECDSLPFPALCLAPRALKILVMGDSSDEENKMADVEDVHSDDDLSQASSQYDGWVIYVTKASGKPCICQLCKAKSDEPSPLRSARETGKHAGKRPWLEYTNNKKNKFRRVKGRKCLICAMFFGKSGVRFEETCDMRALCCLMLARTVIRHASA